MILKRNFASLIFLLVLTSLFGQKKNDSKFDIILGLNSGWTSTYLRTYYTTDQAHFSGLVYYDMNVGLQFSTNKGLIFESGLELYNSGLNIIYTGFIPSYTDEISDKYFAVGLPLLFGLNKNKITAKVGGAVDYLIYTRTIVNNQPYPRSIYNYWYLRAEKRTVFGRMIVSLDYKLPTEKHDIRVEVVYNHIPTLKSYKLGLGIKYTL
jgi:hypothetical protein